MKAWPGSVSRSLRWMLFLERMERRLHIIEWMFPCEKDKLVAIKLHEQRHFEKYTTLLERWEGVV